MNEPHSAHEHPAVHGMLIVGTSNVFLSHLPMFHAPHDYQAIFEVALSEQGTDATAIYQEDRRTSGERVYTWVPKPFALPSLFTPGNAAPQMQGTIFRGHFERGGTPITSDRVRATVTRVLFARKFTPSDAPLSHLQYLLFGTTKEPFVAHVISRPPDYDQILSITMPQPPSGWDGTSVVLEFPDRQNTHDERVREGDALDAVVVPASTAALHLAVRREFYLETSDLA
jgi:hypothetical protein